MGCDKCEKLEAKVDALLEWVKRSEKQYYLLVETSEGYKRKIKELEEELEHAEKLLDKHMHEDD